MEISLTDARKKLTKLVKAVENGYAVTICRRGVPIVDLVSSKTSKGEGPKFGTLRGRIVIHDSDWWKPMD